MRVLATLALALLAGPVVGQDTGLSFLRIGVNAHGGSMGDAQVASVSNAFATYWNPAGLASERRSIAGSHRIWVGDVRAYDIAAQLPAGRNSAWGLSLTATDSGDLEARTQPGEPDGMFSAQFINAGVSYARAIRGLRIGITGRYLRERIFDTNASGYAFDAGIQADLLSRSLNVGASVRNIGRMSELEFERTPLPRLLQGGIALSPLQIVGYTDNVRLLDLALALETSHLFDDNLTRLHVGISVKVMELVDLRGGYVSSDELRDYTFGLGLSFDGIYADYAYIPFEGGFDGPGHILSLLYHW
ncbi:MAG: PorV/PorQ family protein [Rhodothermaceae bacterium]|nr:PorV/PorQ family protein [Rhodothermaceae bacterium]MXX58751.1 PorV/PorQ family protein [Rhodothermaceae bacterium]MYD18134.1 PorV/PorQ family protein [Rhodothermaceae bacterium]MYD57119.1 PorV/PorQ family protein [Rhodothermaceae bacterium]MYI44675.1 PorV/PorQ family protein [Rhodothermaceae bacterium]